MISALSPTFVLTLCIFLSLFVILCLAVFLVVFVLLSTVLFRSDRKDSTTNILRHPLRKRRVFNYVGHWLLLSPNHSFSRDDQVLFNPRQATDKFPEVPSSRNAGKQYNESGDRNIPVLACFSDGTVCTPTTRSVVPPKEIADGNRRESLHRPTRKRSNKG
jgi:hypothetical protein